MVPNSAALIRPCGPDGMRYGFSPVKIEKSSGIKFADMFHGHDERIPVAGLHWGTEVLDAVVREFASIG